MNPMIRRFSFGLLMVASTSLAGCGASQTSDSTSSSDQHDHDKELHAGAHKHAAPKSLDGALKQLDELRTAVKTAFSAGDLEKADGPVHEVGHLLEALPELAVNESLSEANQQQVEQAVDSLMASFAALDERVHGGDAAGKSYDEVASEIDEALAKLKAIKLPEDQS